MSNHFAPPSTTVCAPIEDDEHLPNYLWRCALFSGRRRMKGTMQLLVGRQTLQPPWLVPSNLGSLCERLAPALGTPEDVLRRHTCMPAHLPFVRPEALGPLMSHLMDGRRVPGIATRVGLASAAIRSKPALALCPVCVEEDLQRLGFAYWHRAHLVGGLGVCPHHGCALVAGCGRCIFSQPSSRMPRLPQLQCWCGQPHAAHHVLAADDHAALVRIATLTLDLLADRLHGRGPAEIGACLRLRAIEAGYGAGQHLHTPRLAHDICERYSPAVLARLNAELPTPGQNWLSQAVAGAMAPLVLGRNLLLFDFFGGGLPSTEEFDRAKSLSRPQVGPCYPRVDARERMVNRAELIGHQHDHPGVSRTQLARACPTAVLWARRHDREWYDQTFPAAVKHQPRAGTQEASTRRRDERTAEHVLQRREALLAGLGRPMQLTRATLLRGARRCSETTSKRSGHLPLTSAALASCVESRRTYQKRYARWLLVHHAQAGDPVRAASRRTGLPLAEVERLHRSLRQEVA